MYPRSESSPVQPQPASKQKKVDVVCDALRSVMESMDPNKSVKSFFFFLNDSKHINVTNFTICDLKIAESKTRKDQ